MGLDKEVPGGTRTIYCAEGSIHLYSSEASVLTPADLYRVKDDPAMRQLLHDCNIYLIVARPRILIDPDDFRIAEGELCGRFIVQRPDGIVRVPFTWRLPDAEKTGRGYKVAIAATGTHVDLSICGRQSMVPAHVVVTHAQSGLQDRDKDLEVLYVGQGIGRSRQRSALDRLLTHSTLQRILAEMSTFHPHAEVLLLLYRFEHCRTIISSGGDLTAEPLANGDEEMVHFDRMGKASFSRRERVALAEAGLIKYFQPWFNVQIKSNNFSGAKKIKILERLLNSDLAGLIVEICSANIGARLRTEHASPLNLHDVIPADALDGSRLENGDEKAAWQRQLHAMAHTHYAPFPLTTVEERDTFMHGVRWHGAEERADFLKTGAT
jgi:hypothetical protein